MDNLFYHELANKSLRNEILTNEQCTRILGGSDVELLPLLNAAFTVRSHYWGRDVTIHIINNVQNGLCAEDCHYCAQSKLSKAAINTYPMKSDEEILEEAQDAYRSGAFRYCMVFSGKSQTNERIAHLAKLVGQIKERYAMEVCVSPGFITDEQARILKAAGLDRINHNINTAETYYKNICTTHDFSQRLKTLRAAQKAGLDICSGIIVGMGESPEDIIQAALTLRELERVKSIPVNFFLPINGTACPEAQSLTPEFCLRVLCLFRFLNPAAEIRMAAGREYHLRSLEAFGLFAANSLFMDGYLNVKGATRLKTLQMIKDAGFSIKSDQDLEALIKWEKQQGIEDTENKSNINIKNLNDLHPFIKTP